MTLTFYFTNLDRWIDIDFADKNMLRTRLLLNPGPGIWWIEPIQVFDRKGKLLRTFHFDRRPWDYVADKIFKLCE
jgi:hypothetical protein